MDLQIPLCARVWRLYICVYSCLMLTVQFLFRLLLGLLLQVRRCDEGCDAVWFSTAECEAILGHAVLWIGSNNTAVPRVAE